MSPPEKYTHIGFPQHFSPEAWPRWTILCLVLSRWQVRAVCVLLDYMLNRPAIFLLQCHGALVRAFMRGYSLRGWALNGKSVRIKV